jgi:hypothetical protein
VLCQRFIGLTPFAILNTPFDEVIEIYVDCILNDRKNKKGNKQSGGIEWVTSKNATWH